MVALITPFDAKGRIDVRRLQELVSWHVTQGTDGIVCCGSTGEATTLSEADRKKVVSACLEAADKKILIFAGTGTCDTRQTVRLTEQAQRLGAQGCLVITPYYNKPTQRGCLLHFQQVSSVGLPMIIYNNPARTMVQLQPETIAALSQLPAVVALKESTIEPGFISRIRALTELPILAGEDVATYAMLEEGAVGAISVIGNVCPSLWKQMIVYARAKDRRALELLHQLDPFLKALSLEINPQGIKYAVSLIGKCLLQYRLPLTEPSRSVCEEIKRNLEMLQNIPGSQRIENDRHIDDLLQ